MQVGFNSLTPNFGKVILNKKDKENIISKGPEYCQAVLNVVEDQRGVTNVNIVNSRRFSNGYKPAITFVNENYYGKNNQFMADETEKAKSSSTFVTIPYTSFNDYTGLEKATVSYDVGSKSAAKAVKKEYNNAETDIEKTAIFATLANNNDVYLHGVL